MTLTNGNIPDSLLKTIDGHGTRLRDWCADVWRRMVADALADNITLTPSYTPPPAPAGLAGYRDYDVQVWLYRHPTGPVPIARPTTSTHGLGNRLDVGHGIDWIVPRMGQYGLWREFSSEPWHFGFRTTLAGLGLTPITDTRRNSMATGYWTVRDGKTEWALAGDGQGDAAWIPLGAQDLANAVGRVHGTFVQLAPSDFDAFKVKYTSASVTTPGTMNLDSLVTALGALPEQIAAEIIRQSKLPGN